MPDNYDAVRTLQAMAQAVRMLPTRMAEFYANGGAGNANPVVGDRFGPTGNTRFEPLSAKYAAWKSGNVKARRKKASEKFGKGFQGNPILVLTGALRAAVTARDHVITQSGNTASVRFVNLPEYAKYLHDPKSKKMPKRSPVEPNAEDINRIKMFALRYLKAQYGMAPTGVQGKLGSTPSII